jgi:hypothetical protein
MRRRAWVALTLAAATVGLGAAPALDGDEPLPVGGLTALPPPEAPGPSLLDNGDLAVRDGDGVAGWHLTPDDAWTIVPNGRDGRPALRFSGAHSARQAPSAEQTVTLEPGLYTLEGWVRADGLGASVPRSGVRLCLDGRPRLSWWQCTPVARGTTGWTRLAQPAIAVRERGAYRVTVGAYGKPDGVAWLSHLSLTGVRPPPLDVYLLYPNFRGLLFDDRPQPIRVALAATGSRPPDTRIRVSLVDERRGDVLQQRDYPAASPVTAVLDASALPAGPALVRAELLDGAGVPLYRHPAYRVVKAPARARERLRIWYDERNVAHLDGKPAFVIGLYTTSGYSTTRRTYATGRDGWGNDRIVQAPVNMLINYHLGQAPVPALMTYMDDLRARGIFYLQTANFYHEAHPQYRTIPYPAAREGDAALNRWVARTLGAHPGFAGFYTADERPAEMVPTVFRQHRTLAEAAPGHVTYAVLGDGWQHQAPLWRDALDVMGLDPYPIVRPSGDNHLAMVGDWTRIGQDAVKGSRPLWMVIQYFPLTRAGGWPTEGELRTMSWMAIVEGARGLFYWSFGSKGLAWVKDPAERERRWQELVRVTREIKALEPVLLAPDAHLLARASGGEDAVRTLGKRMPDGSRYLFAYNTRRDPVRLTWTLAAPAVTTLDLTTNTPGPRPTGDTLTVDFAPYEVKRLRLE